jgi:hypothetical protein
MENFESIRKLVKKGESGAMTEALQQLQTIFISRQFDPNPVDLLESRFKNNERQNILGILDPNDFYRENNRITKSVLDLISLLERGDDFSDLKPLSIHVIRQNIGKTKIEVEFEAFQEKHTLQFKTRWLSFLVFHNENTEPIYKRSNSFNFHEELHAFKIPTSNNGSLNIEFSTSYNIWTATLRNPKLKIENTQILPHA